MLECKSQGSSFKNIGAIGEPFSCHPSFSGHLLVFAPCFRNLGTDGSRYCSSLSEGIDDAVSSLEKMISQWGQMNS